MTDLMGALALVTALGAIYAFMFRGLFGKHRGSRVRPNTDGSGWATAFMGGFAAGTIAAAAGAVSWGMAIAVIAGVSCGFGKSWHLFALPAAGIGVAATLIGATELVRADPRNVANLVLMAAALCLFGLAELTRFFQLGNSRRPSPADRAMSYLAAVEAVTFLVGPGGAPMLDSLDVPWSAIVLCLAFISLPPLLGGLDSAYLTMFTAAVSLGTLILEFAGLGELGFLAGMGLIGAAMASYWIVRWVVRGFSGVGLLSD